MTFRTMTAVALALLAASRAGAGVPLDSSFTYQGRLFDDGAPVDGGVAMTFRLYDLAVGGVLIGTGEIEIDPVTLADGLFTVVLDFGPDAFVGAERFLEIEVAGQILSPRQLITSAPQSLYSRHTRGLAVDVQGNVGIGVDMPSSPLHVVTSDASAAFLAETHTNGGVGAWFLASGVDGVALVTTSGRVGLGTSFPVAKVHVCDDPLVGIDEADTQNDDLIVEDNDAILGLFSNQGGTFGSGIALREIDGGGDLTGTWGIIRETGAGGGLRFTSGPDPGPPDNPTSLYLDAGGRVGINTLSPAAALDVERIDESTPVVRLEASAPGGTTTWVEFDSTAFGVIGTIHSVGGNVLYGGFTGVHYAWSADADVAPGTLMRMTGDNRAVTTLSSDAEPVYGVAPTTRANDPACLGAFAAFDGDRLLIAAVGNGRLSVTPGTNATDIEPGDLLVSSDVPGCAMKDDATRFATGYVVARAAEGVDWSRVPPDADGVCRSTISVLFDGFVREGGDAPLRDLIARQQARIEALESRLEALEAARR